MNETILSTGEKRRKTLLLIALIALSLAYYASQAYLYSKQTVKGDYYFSDMYLYMDWIRQGVSVYSMVGTVLGASDALAGDIGVGIAQMLFSLASWLAAAWVLFDLTGRRADKAELLLTALISQIMISAYIPGRQLYRQLYLTLNNYHSPTYIEMEPFAIIAMGCLYKLLRQLDGKLDKKYLAVFALTCTVGAYAKPSFLFCMAPALLIWLIADFFGTGFKNIGNEVLLGICVLPGVAVALYQSAMLFDESAIIVFSPMFYGERMPEGLLRAGAFALAVMICYGKDFIKTDNFKITALTALVGVGEFFLLAETGERAQHGNLAWSAQIGLYLLTLFCLSVLYSKREERKSAKFIICSLILLWQLLSGAAYYYLMLRGVSFWI